MKLLFLNTSVYFNVFFLGHYAKKLFLSLRYSSFTIINQQDASTLKLSKWSLFTQVSSPHHTVNPAEWWRRWNTNVSALCNSELLTLWRWTSSNYENEVNLTNFSVSGSRTRLCLTHLFVVQLRHGIHLASLEKGKRESCVTWVE